jgi:biotin carboxyl carrier protein
MTRQFVVNGENRSLEVRPEEFSIVEVEPGVYSVLLNDASYLAQVTRDGSTATVEVRGHVFEVEVVDPRAAKKRGGGPAGEGRQTILSPMPGKIVRLLVREGDTVEAGQGIVVMEAMKMQNELKALRGGVVTSLPMAEGATVSAGQVLASIE